MSAIEPGTDAETMRQLGIGAALLELWHQRERDDYTQRAEQFNATHTAADVVAGLLYIAEYALLSALGEEEFVRLLGAWQTSAALDAALRDASGEDASGQTKDVQ